MPREKRTCSVDGCEGGRRARGLCNAHYLRLKRHGDPCVGGPVRRLDRGVEARFWEKVERGGPTAPHMDTPCWIWTAGTGGHGYGNFDGTTAHRVSFVMSGANLPDRLHVLHRCDNKRCVRPDHLYAGTPSDNARDREARTPVGWRARGESIGASKLTADVVKECRARVARGETVASLAREFDVSWPAMGDAVKGRNWKWVE